MFEALIGIVAILVGFAALCVVAKVFGPYIMENLV